MEIKEALDSAEFVDSDGRMTCTGVLARTGVQEYSASSLGLPGDTVRLYRPHSEVFDKASMASFDGVAVTIGHEIVTADNWKSLSVGDVRGIQRDGDLMTGTVMIRDSEAIATVKRGLVALSNGYSFDLDMTPGVTPSGEAYDGVQRKIRGNHLAIVERARCGDRCKLAVYDEEEVKPMENEVTVTVEAKAESHEDAIAALEATIAELRTQLAAAEVAVADSVEKLSAVNLTKLAKDWAEMTVVGERIVPGFAADGVNCATDYKRAIVRQVMAIDGDSRKNAVSAILGGKTACDSCETVVESAFRFLAIAPEVKKPEVLGAALVAKDSAEAQEMHGAHAFHARLINGFK